MKKQSIEEIAKMLSDTKTVVIVLRKDGIIDIVTNFANDDDITDTIINGLTVWRKDLRSRKTGPNVN